MKKEEPKSENSRYSLFSPKCCKEHKDATTKRRHLETSEWIFENDPIVLQDKNFDPWNREMPSTQRKIKCMGEIDKNLEHGSRQALIEEIKKVAAEDNGELLGKELAEETTHSEPLSGRKEKESESLESLKEREKDVSPYLILLNRLDELDGIRTPSIEDKLKLAEDSLRVSTEKFCDACSELIEEKQEDPDVTSGFPFLSPGKVHEAFRAKVFDPSLRPPQTLSVLEAKKEPVVGISESAQLKKESRRKEMRMKEMFKQGFYLPCDTWFHREKETPKLTPEELDILNSTSTKAFVKFLEERKKSPPKVLQEIQKKLESMKESETPK